MRKLTSFFVRSLLQLSEIVNQGKLVSDEIIISLLSKRLEAGEAKGESGFILDGFPRTIRQAVSIFHDVLFLFIFWYFYVTFVICAQIWIDCLCS